MLWHQTAAARTLATYLQFSSDDQIDNFLLVRYWSAPDIMLPLPDTANNFASKVLNVGTITRSRAGLLQLDICGPQTIAPLWAFSNPITGGLRLCQVINAQGDGHGTSFMVAAVPASLPHSPPGVRHATSCLAINSIFGRWRKTVANFMKIMMNIDFNSPRIVTVISIGSTSSTDCGNPILY